MTRRIEILLIALVLPGCSRKPAPKVEAALKTPAVESPAPEVQPKAEDPRARIQDLLARVFQPVYFPFDQAVLSSEARKLLAEAATLLRAEPGIKVTIQGNTDDLGTSEYNLALGQRRAQVVKDYLLEFGIEAGRLQIISYGEEKPAQEGREEGARAMNRRDEFLVTF